MERLRWIAIVGLVVFSGTLGVLLVRELSADALAMLLGVGCGILASLPLGIVMLVWSNRSTERARQANGHERNAAPVIIVSPGAQAVPSSWSNAPAWLPPARDFQTEGDPRCRVLGEPAQEYAAAGWQQGAGGAQDGWAEEGGIGW